MGEVDNKPVKPRETSTGRKLMISVKKSINYVVKYYVQF